MGHQLGAAVALQSYSATWHSLKGMLLGQVVLRKMLRAVEALPLSADDVHLTRSAHGTFGDILQLLSYHSDLEVQPPAHHQQICTESFDFHQVTKHVIVALAGKLRLLGPESRAVLYDQVRTKSTGLLRQYPMSACTRPVVRGSGSLAGAGSPASGGLPNPVSCNIVGYTFRNRASCTSILVASESMCHDNALACRRLLRWRAVLFGSIVLHGLPLVWRRPAAAAAVEAAQAGAQPRRCWHLW